MRLLDAVSIQDGGSLPRLVEFDSNHVLDYGILSHTWGMHEIQYADIKQPKIKTWESFQKTYYGCVGALNDGLQYLWVDTCCI